MRKDIANYQWPVPKYSGTWDTRKGLYEEDLSAGLGEIPVKKCVWESSHRILWTITQVGDGRELKFTHILTTETYG